MRWFLEVINKFGFLFNAPFPLQVCFVMDTVKHLRMIPAQ